MFPASDGFGIGSRRGYRAEIAGVWMSELFDNETDAKWWVAEHGLAVIEPLYKELKKLHVKSKARNQSRGSE